MAAAGPAPGDARVVYFGRLDREVTDEEFKAIASRAGAVANVDRRRGFAYVTYASASDAEKALATLNGLKVNTRELTVEKSLTDEARAARPRPERAPRQPRAPRPATATEGGADAAPVRFSDKRVVVYGLAREFDAAKLTDYFNKFGTVLRSRMGAGLGRVSFETAEAAERALANPKHTIEGSETTIEKERARPRRRRAPKSGGAAGASTGAAGGAGASSGAAATGTRAPRTRPAAGAAAAGGAGASSGAAGSSVPRPPRRLRVQGLVTGMTADQLKSLFQTIAPVASAKIVGTGSVGFVTFETAEGAQQALKLDGTTVSGHTLSITIDSSQRTRRRRGRGGAGAGAGGEEGAAVVRAPRETRPPRDPSELVHTAWVTGLSPDKTTEANLRTLFAPFGAVEAVTVLGDRRQSAYIKFSTEREVTAAVAGLNGRSVDGAEKPLRVEAATGKSTRSPRRRGEASPAEK